MQLIKGKVCSICEAGKLEVSYRDLEFEYKGNKFTVPNMKLYECDECEETLFDSKDERKLEKKLTDNRRIIDGLLTSQEIKEIREKFQMTQIQFAKLLRVGTKNFARYESGQSSQGYAMDNLLRILKKYPFAIDAIVEQTPAKPYLWLGAFYGGLQKWDRSIDIELEAFSYKSQIKNIPEIEADNCKILERWNTNARTV